MKPVRQSQWLGVSTADDSEDAPQGTLREQLNMIATPGTTTRVRTRGGLDLLPNDSSGSGTPASNADDSDRAGYSGVMSLAVESPPSGFLGALVKVSRGVQDVCALFPLSGRFGAALGQNTFTELAGGLPDLYEGSRRVGLAVQDGQTIICIERERPQVIFERESATFERVPLGLVRPMSELASLIGTITFMPDTGAGDKIPSTTYWVRYSFYASRYGWESDLSDAISVSMGASDYSIQCQISYTAGTNGHVDARISSYWGTASLIHVDSIKVYVTESDPAYTDQEKGSYYWEKTIKLETANTNLTNSDAYNAGVGIQHSGKRATCPDVFSVAIHGGCAWYTGQRDYTLANCSFTNGSNAVSLHSSTYCPSGLLNRWFIAPDGQRYTVIAINTNWTGLYLDRNYQGTSTPGGGPYSTIILRGEKSAVWCSETSSVDGLPLPEAVPFTNIVRTSTNLWNECVVSVGELLLVVAGDGIWYITDRGAIPRLIERIPVITEGDRNVAAGASGELFLMSSLGIRLTVDGSRTVSISEAISDWWSPRNETELYIDHEYLHLGHMFYDAADEVLYAFVPTNGSGGKCDTLLRWDRRAARRGGTGWSIHRFVLGTESEAAIIDFQASCVIADVDGESLVVLSGQFSVDTDGDDAVDTEHYGRNWLWNGTGATDEVPLDKDATISNHGVRWRLKTHSAHSGDGSRVTVRRARIFSSPTAGSVRAFAAVEVDTSDSLGPVQELPAIIEMRKASEAFALPRNGGHAVRLLLSGEVTEAAEKYEIREVVWYVDVIPDGGQRP